MSETSRSVGAMPNGGIAPAILDSVRDLASDASSLALAAQLLSSFSGLPAKRSAR